MHFVPVSQTENTLVANWQAVNGAVYCRRMSACLTMTACKQNQCLSYMKGGDARCLGCNGLYDQAESHPEVSFVPAHVVDSHIEGIEALEEIIKDLCDDPADDDDFDDLEIDIEDDELLALFPELAADPWPDYQPFSERRKAARPRLAHPGRCKRCNGWMEHAPEPRDFNTFKCINCGWITGDAYERNRAIHAAGGTI